MSFKFRWFATHRSLALSMLAICLANAPAAAQPGPPARVRGEPVAGMATRSVSKYLGLERSLQEGLANRDRASVRALLADDFELRTAASPDVVAADDWLLRVLVSGGQDHIVQDLGVRELDDIAVVSFLLQPSQARPRTRANVTMFVVDVWRQSSSKLISRYIEQPAVAPARRLRPSGRE